MEAPTTNETDQEAQSQARILAEYTARDSVQLTDFQQNLHTLQHSHAFESAVLNQPATAAELQTSPGVVVLVRSRNSLNELVDPGRGYYHAQLHETRQLPPLDARGEEKKELRRRAVELKRMLFGGRRKAEGEVLKRSISAPVRESFRDYM